MVRMEEKRWSIVTSICQEQVGGEAETGVKNDHLLSDLGFLG